MIQLYHKKVLWLILLIAWTLLIIYMSLKPGANELLKKHIFELRMDYILHFLAYFTFGFLYVLWRGNSNFEIRSMELAIITAAAIGFSILLEYFQLLIPGRSFNVVDMVYNTIGAIVGVGITYLYFLRHFLRKRYFPQSE